LFPSIFTHSPYSKKNKVGPGCLWFIVNTFSARSVIVNVNVNNIAHAPRRSQAIFGQSGQNTAAFMSIIAKFA